MCNVAIVKPNSVKLAPKQQIAFCPNIKRSVPITQLKYFSISNGQAGWWHCPVCQGWHVQINNINAGSTTN